MVIRGLSASATVAVGAATAAAFGLNYGISRRRGRTQGLLQRKDSSAQNPSALSSSMLGISASVWKAWELVGPVVLAKEAENIVVSGKSHLRNETFLLGNWAHGLVPNESRIFHIIEDRWFVCRASWVKYTAARSTSCVFPGVQPAPDLWDRLSLS